MQYYYIIILSYFFIHSMSPIKRSKRNYASTFSWKISMQLNSPLMLKDSYKDNLPPRRPAVGGLGTKPELNNRKERSNKQNLPSASLSSPR